GRRLDLASRLAETKHDAANMVASELGLAKVFGLNKLDGVYQPGDVNAPSSAQISKAIALNDAFFDGLERIADGSSANNHFRACFGDEAASQCLINQWQMLMRH